MKGYNQFFPWMKQNAFTFGFAIDSCDLGAPTCNIIKHFRRVCGWLGMKKAHCQDLGCCYDDRASGWYRCFYPKQVTGKILYHSCFL